MKSRERLDASTYFLTGNHVPQQPQSGAMYPALRSAERLDFGAYILSGEDITTVHWRFLRGLDERRDA